MKTARNGSVGVRVKTVGARSFIVSAFRSDTVLDLKERITQKTGLIPRKQRLVFRGTVLVDDLTLGFYGINSHQTVYLAPNKRYTKVQQKPIEKLQRIIDLVQQLDTSSPTKYNEVMTELKELINDPLVNSYARVNRSAANALQLASEAMEISERPPSSSTEQFISKQTDYALSIVESAPDGLRMLQSIINDYSSDDETPYLTMPTKINYKPRISKKPLPTLNSSNVFHAAAYRTLLGIKDTGITSHDSDIFKSDPGDLDDLISIPFGDDVIDLCQKFAPQIETLKEMGFKDESNILQALGETNGNVQKAAKILQNKFFYHV